MYKVLQVIANKLIEVIIVLLLWSFLWCFFPTDVIPPSGNLFWLLTLFILAYWSGQLFALVGAPSLLGMLLAGFALKNGVPSFFIESHISATCRTFALTIILLLAGLELNPTVIKKLSGVCLRLTIVPLLIEAVALAVCTKLFLGLDWIWGILIGFIVGAVSPDVIIAQMVKLTEKRLGTGKGIPTIVIAASSLDDALVITAFGVLLGIIFPTADSLTWQIIEGPLEAVLGLLFGCLVGCFLWYFPLLDNSSRPEECSEDRKVEVRLALTVLFGLSLVFVTQELGFAGAGPLSALTLTFVAGLKWRETGKNKAIKSGLNQIWFFCEPLLFALTGSQIDVHQIDYNTIGFSILCLTIALLCRSLTTMTILWGAQLSVKEKLFVAIALIPKAIVPAALGPMALDMAIKLRSPEGILNGTLILNIAVLSILLSSPLGALLTSVTSSLLLEKDECSTENNNYGTMSDVDVLSQ